MTKGLGITWKLHMAYHPQNAGKIEHIIRKIATGKTMLGDPPTMGSITAHSLAQDEVKPHQMDRSLPFEILFGHSPPLVKSL
jgi:hypothetical protein